MKEIEKFLVKFAIYFVISMILLFGGMYLPTRDTHHVMSNYSWWVYVFLSGILSLTVTSIDLYHPWK
jgi:hypothetical protein